MRLVAEKLGKIMQGLVIPVKIVCLGRKKRRKTNLVWSHVAEWDLSYH